MQRLRWAVGAAVTLALGLLIAGGGNGQQVLQHGFEARDPIWVPGQFDAAYKELAHRLTTDFAHTGHKSEFIQLQAEKGSFIHYSYPIGRAPVADELNVSLWVKANRPGVQLLCRVVLPRERDPQNPEQPLTVLLDGDAYQLTGRWQQVTVRQPVKRLSEKQQMLQRLHNRDILTADAYVDRVLINLYCGPGQTDVWTDDLEVGPILGESPAAQGTGKELPARPAVNRRAAEIQLRDGQLFVDGKGFFLRGIRHTGTPLKTLREARFNTVWLDETAAPNLVEEAANLGFWVVPGVTPPPAAPRSAGPLDARLTAANETFGRTMAAYMASDAVLAYDVGGNLRQEQFAAVARDEKAFHSVDPTRPVCGDVLDGLKSYGNGGVDKLLLGMHRWPLMTGLELTAYRDWLVQRRRLAPPSAFCWTWVQTHLDDWYTDQVYGRPADAGFNEPVGPQAEQIRLLTYTAVGSGYRGVAFWSDRFLADSHAGRDRLLALAQLNQELEMLEPLLVAAGEPKWIDTSRPEVKAAVFRGDKAILVLPVWLGPSSQFVPGQAASSELDVVVPAVPPSFLAWEVSPGYVRSLNLKEARVPGGTKVKLREFSLTSAVVFTADLGPKGLVVRFQEQQRAMARRAAQWAHEQAQEEFTKIEKVQAELDEMGVKLKDGDQLMTKARTSLEACATLRRNGDYGEAYAEAQRALRPLRILTRAQWERSVRDLDSPVASPYGGSFFTLPRHLRFMQEVQRTGPAANVLPGGDFELPMDRVQDWTLDDPPPLDDVVMQAERVGGNVKEGKQCLKLEIRPKDPALPPLALERSYLAVHSPDVKLPPGTLVQITGWVMILKEITASVDGALVYDSAGGEPLGLRLTGATPWKKFTLYRRVPASGSVNVTLALTGLGTVYFDDVRVEPRTRAATSGPTGGEKPGPR